MCALTHKHLMVNGVAALLERTQETQMARRGELFGTLLRQEVAFFDAEEVGVLTSRLGSDCQAVVRALSTNINVALRNALQALGEAPRALL